MIDRLNAEAERHAMSAVGVVGVAAAVGVDIAEVRAVGGVRRTQPPEPSAVVSTFFYTVTLSLENVKVRIVRLILRPTAFTKRLSFGNEEKERVSMNLS